MTFTKKDLKIFESLFNAQLSRINALSTQQQVTYDKLMKQLNPKTKPVKIYKCHDCGLKDNTVVRTTCPYASEINNDYTQMNLCPECSNRRAEDI